MTLAQAVPSLTGHSPIESEHGGQRWVLVKEFINSPRPGRWCTRSRGQPGRLHRNKWRHGRKQGWKQGYNMGPKSIQKVRPNTGLQTIYKVHSACLTMRPDTYNIAPRPTQKAGSPTVKLMQRLKAQA